MAMFAFLRSPKWLFGHALVLAVVVSFTSLGLWQLRRLDEARSHNAHLEERMAADPVSLGAALDEGASFSRVTTRGEYVAEAQTFTAPRGRDGNPGHHVLTPLETPDGTVLVDRGWVPFEREGVPAEAVAPPEGEVEVRGLLMPAEEGDPGEGENVRMIDPAEVEDRTGVPLESGYLQLQESEPQVDGAPLAHAQPVLDEGNHLSYAIQWFLFTGVVLIGYPILIRRTGRERSGAGDGDAEGAEPPVPAGA